MSKLVPCPACERHVRLTSASCPFCDAALDVSALEGRYASRRGGAPAGAKRAVVFALGTGMAAACAQSQPVYGAPVTFDPDAAITVGGSTSGESASDTEGNAQPLYGAPVDTTGDTTSENGDTTFVAIYGGPVAPQDAGTSDTLVTNDAATNDATTNDATTNDATTNDATDESDTTDEYGNTSLIAIYGASVPPRDGGTSDAPMTSDAGLADAAVDTDDPIAQPLYGAPAFLDGAVFDPGPAPAYGGPPSEQ